MQLFSAITDFEINRYKIYEFRKYAQRIVFYLTSQYVVRHGDFATSNRYFDQEHFDVPFTHTHTHTRTRTRTRTRARARACARARAHTHMHAHTHVCTHAHAHTHARAHTHICTRARTHTEGHSNSLASGFGTQLIKL